MAHLGSLVRINSAPFEQVEINTGTIIFNFHVDIWAFGAGCIFNMVCSRRIFDVAYRRMVFDVACGRMIFDMACWNMGDLMTAVNGNGRLLYE